jgi:hypothetical protein
LDARLDAGGTHEETMLDLVIALLTAFGLGNITGSIATHFLSRRAEEQRRRVETDRATYERRTTVLITTTLAALIRSDRCREHERSELAELIQNLGAGEHRGDFLDPRVRRAWGRFLERSAECGWKRLAGTITERDIDAYVKAHEAWDIAARRSFGPLPERGERPSMREGERGDRAKDRDAA